MQSESKPNYSWIAWILGLGLLFLCLCGKWDIRTSPSAPACSSGVRVNGICQPSNVDGWVTAYARYSFGVDTQYSTVQQAVTAAQQDLNGVDHPIFVFCNEQGRDTTLSYFAGSQTQQELCSQGGYFEVFPVDN